MDANSTLFGVFAADWLRGANFLEHGVKAASGDTQDKPVQNKIRIRAYMLPARVSLAGRAAPLQKPKRLYSASDGRGLIEWGFFHSERFGRVRLLPRCFKLSGHIHHTMKIGCHVSISGGIEKAVGNAKARGCTAFQIFTRNPRGWRAKPISDEEASSYRQRLADSGIDRMATCAHMPYLPNLAGPNAEPYKKSVDTLKDEVARCGMLGIPYLVTHLGSHLGTGPEAGIKRLAEAYAAAATIDNDVTILLENMAGQKNSIGYDFEEWADILNRLEPSGRFGVCFDTCHAFVAGYDMRTEEAAARTLDDFDRHVGHDRLKVLHLNDARGELGCNLDRHHHIGLGQIGSQGLGYVVRTMDRLGVPIILETPIDDTRTDVDNLRVARQLA